MLSFVNSRVQLALLNLFVELQDWHMAIRAFKSWLQMLIALTPRIPGHTLEASLFWDFPYTQMLRAKWEDRNDSGIRQELDVAIASFHASKDTSKVCAQRSVRPKTFKRKVLKRILKPCTRNKVQIIRSKFVRVICSNEIRNNAESRTGRRSQIVTRRWRTVTGPLQSFLAIWICKATEREMRMPSVIREPLACWHIGLLLTFWLIGAGGCGVFVTTTHRNTEYHNGFGRWVFVRTFPLFWTHFLVVLGKKYKFCTMETSGRVPCKLAGAQSCPAHVW